MMVLFKTLGFSLLLILAFTVTTYILPQMRGEAPKEKVAIDVGSLTMDVFVAMGADLYEGAGSCKLCHNNLGRAPDLLAMNAVSISLERMADTQYQGNAKDAEGYLRESMTEPSIYVVKGFGKKGTNDAESPMPASNKAPALLSDMEINAIVAYLQDKDGNKVTVALPEKGSAPDPVSTSANAKPKLAQTPEEAIAKFGCMTCHSIQETESTVGPDLRDVGTRLSIDQIRESIIAPNAVIAEGYPPIMPDISDQMMLKELEMIVQFLVKQTGSQP